MSNQNAQCMSICIRSGGVNYSKKISYEGGYRYCSKCVKYFSSRYQGLRCPCCNTQLRTRKRNS